MDSISLISVWTSHTLSSRARLLLLQHSVRRLTSGNRRLQHFLAINIDTILRTKIQLLFYLANGLGIFPAASYILDIYRKVQ